MGTFIQMVKETPISVARNYQRQCLLSGINGSAAGFGVATKVAVGIAGSHAPLILNVLHVESISIDII